MLSKSVVFYLSVVLLLIFNFSCQNDDTEIDLSKVESQDLLEASYELLQEKNSMQALLALQGLQMDLVVTSDEENADIRYETSDTSVYDDLKIRADLVQYFSELWFTQNLIPPSSVISTEFLKYDFKHEHIKEFWSTYRDSEEDVTTLPEFPEIIIDTLYYPDGTKVLLGEKFSNLENDIHYLRADIPNARYVEKLDVQVNYRYPKVRSFEFNQNSNRNSIQEYTITSDGFNTSNISLSLPENLALKIIGIKAFHANGKQLYQNSSNSKSMPSDETVAYFEAVIPIYTKALNKVSKGKISSERDLEIFLEKNLPKEPPKEIQLSTLNYKFGGPVERIVLHISTNDLVNVNEKATLHRREDLKTKSNGFYIATDSQMNKFGLVDAYGKWVAEPFADELRNINKFFFASRSWIKDPNNPEHQRSEDKYYWLNSKTKNLESVKFELDNYDIIADRFFTIETETNGPIGAFDAVLGKVVIPMQYSSFNHRDGFFIGRKDGDSEIFTLNGKRLINKKFSRIDVFGDYIYTSTTGKDFDSEDVYDKKGKRITNGQWDISQGFGLDNLMLVTKCKKEVIDGVRHTSGCTSQYLNTKAQIAFDTSNYSQLKAFSNGLAAVKDDDFWGYINPQGKLVIPTMYQHADYFQNKYAYVEKGDKAYLIDGDNNLIKELPDTRRSVTLSIDGNEAQYNLYNGESYNSVGELISP